MKGPDFRAHSLGRRLLVMVTLTMFLALVIMLWVVGRHVHHEAQEVLDVWQLITARDLLRDLEVMMAEERLNDAWLALETTRGLENSWLTHFASSPATLFLGNEHDDASEVDRAAVKAYIWLQDRGGKVLLGERMGGFQSDDGWRHSIVRSVWRDGHRWRVVGVANNDGTHRLYVAQRDDLKQYLSREVGHKLFQLQLVVIPLVVLVLAVGIWRGLRPLSDLSAQIGNRHPDNLEPVSLAGVPRELWPVIEALNSLLERLKRTLEGERAFTADAAHELRHPLAVVRNLAQVVREARDPAELRQCALMLEESLARMNRLLDQLLRLARLDAQAPGSTPHWCRVRTAAENAVSMVYAEAAAKAVQLRFEAEVEARVRMAPDLLEMVLVNLLTNAVKYGRRGGMAAIRLVRRGSGLQLEVADDGPGVSPEQLARLFDRFYRGERARQKGEGSGLGLAIVKRIAELHGIDLTAQNRREGGLRVGLGFSPEQWAETTESKDEPPDEEVRSSNPAA